MYKKFGSDRATAPPFSRMRVQNDSKRARGIDVDKSTRQNATLKKLQRLPPGVASGKGYCQPKNSSVEQKTACCKLRVISIIARSQLHVSGSLCAAHFTQVKIRHSLFWNCLLFCCWTFVYKCKPATYAYDEWGMRFL